MGKTKEDRSGWVAVAPDSSLAAGSRPPIRPASTAYQIFQRENSASIKEDLLRSGQAADLGGLTKAMSERWRSLDPVRKARYEDAARDDAARYARENHARDLEVLQERERKNREREQLVLDDTLTGERTTRSGRMKLKKKEEKEKKKRNKMLKKLMKPRTQQSFHSDDDQLHSEDESSSESDSDYSEKSSDSGSGSGSYSGESDSDEDAVKKKKAKKKKKKPAPPPKRQPSQAVLQARAKARAEKEEKEEYIAGRQEVLRKDRAAQAKRRLEFLLKQSDIFSHFGQVKEDQARYGIRSSELRKSNSTVEEGGTHRSTQVDEEADLEDADEHEASFLTEQPTTLGGGDAKMRAYQLEGLNWMIRLQEHGVNGILADEMGLGKTLQSISMLVYMQEFRGSTGPHLIVVPKSTLSNWMNELKRWGPKLTAVKFHGNKEEREALARDVLMPGQRDENRSWNVCVTTYEVCNLDHIVLNKFAWSYLIIDEAHRLKNEASKFSVTIRTFETRYRLLLTGTPLQNNLHEMWALLNFLVPDVFANAEQFDEWFNLDIDDADEKNKLIKQLHKILRPFMLRRLKVDVETALPPKHETILFTGMSTMQKQLYKDILLRDIDTLQGKGGGSGGGGSRTAILNIVMQLRKCAAHPYLFPGVEDRTLPPLGEHLVQNCGKLVLLDKLLLRMKELGHRILLFTQMTRVLDILEDYMVMRRFKYCRIDGNTSYDDREERIDSFNAPDSDKFMFLLSTRAGGLGINLQTANVVILYDSDWNPQADLQAQDRAHRIGQKKEVQVFRLVTEHTVEEKVVERAQQKLKLDAMVVQQGRLKEKDKLSRDELLEAVRFGADKVFKSKDSSITDDDIDLILEAGKRKTQELNDKLQNAEKGDMLDFKLDGNTSLQTFEGVDYSQQGDALARAKAEQAQAELLGILDMGKRERRTVANYNENQLYQNQMRAGQQSQASAEGARGPPKKKRTKEIRLPRWMRLPRLEEWQMFDRDALQALQEEEEAAFRSLPEEGQKMLSARVKPGAVAVSAPAPTPAPVPTPAGEEAPGVETAAGAGDAAGPPKPTEPDNEIPGSDGGPSTANASGESALAVEANSAPTASDEKAEEDGGDNGDSDGGTPPKMKIDPSSLPPLLSEEKLVLKKRLLAEGFADWHRYHYASFVKSSARHGRDNYAKIAADVGKPVSAVRTYALAFWDEEFGRKRFSEHEYDRSVKTIERGEKKIEENRGMRRGTRVLLSLFDNPWEELEFTHVNCRDKVFTPEEDRYLLCWAHKYGYGQWNAVKMAIRRSPAFRFDYYLRCLSTEAIGKRCEQLMKAAEREVEQMEKKAREDAGLNAAAEEEKKTDSEEQQPLPPVKLPPFRVMQAERRRKAEEDLAAERSQLEEKVEEIEGQIGEVQRRMKELQEYSRDTARSFVHPTEVPDEVLPELANLVARSGPAGIMTVASEFHSRNPSFSKKIICSKIDEIAKKEKRKDEGDTKPCWYVLEEYKHLLDVETLRYLRKTKEERLTKEEEWKKGSRRKREEEDYDGGAVGPDGDLVPFPEFDGSEPPKENKKAFTLFCNGTRREVKASLDRVSRKDKSRVNGILKERWFSLSNEEKDVWKKWQVWDEKRYRYQMRVFEDAERKRAKSTRRDSNASTQTNEEGEANMKPEVPEVPKEAMNTIHIPKKKKKRPIGDQTFSSIPKKRKG